MGRFIIDEVNKFNLDIVNVQQNNKHKRVWGFLSPVFVIGAT